MPGREEVPEGAVKHNHDWGAPVKVERLGGHYNLAVQGCGGCPALRVDNGIVANIYEHADAIRNQERQRIQEALLNETVRREIADIAANNGDAEDIAQLVIKLLAGRLALDTLDPSGEQGEEKQHVDERVESYVQSPLAGQVIEQLEARETEAKEALEKWKAEHPGYHDSPSALVSYTEKRIYRDAILTVADTDLELHVFAATPATDPSKEVQASHE